jgi:serine/threonine protein kinase
MVFSCSTKADSIVLYSRRSGEWKIADFGFTTEGTSNECVISSGLRGTSGYRAPEFFQNNPSFSNKLDIWALGCIFYELVSRRKLFQTDNAVIVYRDTVTNIPLDSNSTFEPHNRETERRLLSLSEFPIGKTVARQPIEEHLLRMLQVEPRVRPSAFILCQSFSQDYRLHIEWLHDLATSKFQACQFSYEEALEEATRRSLGLPMSSEPPTPILSWEEQLRRNEARAGHLLKTQERAVFPKAARLNLQQRFERLKRC